MGHRAGTRRRPVRAAAIVAAVVALLIGSGAASIPGVAVPRVLALALGSGILVGVYAVGLALASDFSAVRWWWISAEVLFAPMAIVVIGLACWPKAPQRWWGTFAGVALMCIVAWLSAGGLLAILGWWSYTRDRRGVVDA